MSRFEDQQPEGIVCRRSWAVVHSLRFCVSVSLHLVLCLRDIMCHTSLGCESAGCASLPVHCICLCTLHTGQRTSAWAHSCLVCFIMSVIINNYSTHLSGNINLLSFYTPPHSLSLIPSITVFHPPTLLFFHLKTSCSWTPEPVASPSPSPLHDPFFFFHPVIWEREKRINMSLRSTKTCMESTRGGLPCCFTCSC